MALKKISKFDLDEVIFNSRSYLKILGGKKVFLTGGTGFFGKWITQVLTAANDVLNLDLRLIILTRNHEKLVLDQPWLNTKCVTLLPGDVKNYNYPDEKIDYFIHAATSSSAHLYYQNPEMMADTIIEGTKRVLSHAELAQKPKFLFISSGAIYGPQKVDHEYVSESYVSGPDITKVTNTYAEAKRMAELYCQFYQHKEAISLSIARCYAFLGPYLPLDQHFAAGNFIKDVIEKKSITIKGNGEPYRSYMYPTDLVEWLLAILTSSKNGEVYNVGSDEKIQLLDLAKLMDVNHLGVLVDNHLKSEFSRDFYLPSIEKAKNELGLSMRIKLEETIQRTINWYKN